MEKWWINHTKSYEVTTNYNQVKSGISYKQHAHLTLTNWISLNVEAHVLNTIFNSVGIPTELCLSKIHLEKIPRQRSREQNQRLVVQPHPANETPTARPRNARPMRHGIWEREIWKRKKVLEKIHSRWIPAFTFLRCTYIKDATWRDSSFLPLEWMLHLQ